MLYTHKYVRVILPIQNWFGWLVDENKCWVKLHDECVIMYIENKNHFHK